MPITDQTYIRTCANHVILDKFKEPVPTSSILILNECECDRNYLVVAINSDCHQYLTFIFSSQESVIDTEYRKRVLKRPDACTKIKEGSVKNAWSSDHTREVLDIKMASRISLHNFWQAYEACYHMTPHTCQISSRTPFVLPSMPYHS